ncbi:MAG TPA: RNA polymerase sigma factor [Haliscomenobacter sp.]|uniref:RNA polymerase sigma factor n=1 Tax=Haliscomenobacter sp. TaxID=2717303 RepID=UPI002C42070B|nr:RNA polymerase sigma factor [Haliscomenobacter sp.]HOY18267.1 RNA polymerase sigma factor [Haliscomenobacter sp.]HPH18126.1 RNA polymerase sigma factor [Haliscomenobacter sp.]
MENHNLADILKGCRRKERAAQKELYRQFYGYAMSVSLRYCDNEDEAIEVANDAFLKVFLNIQRYDPDMPFKPWFRRILINTAINHIKKKQKLKISTLMDTEYNIPDTEEILARLGFQELMALVRSLSTAYRTVFNLYVMDGFTHEEISQELGISVGTSKSNLSKARERLRQLILQQMQQ